MKTMQEMLDEIQASREAAQTRAEGHRQAIIDTMLACSLTKIEIEFSGCGDEGYIQDIRMYGIDNTQLLVKENISLIQLKSKVSDWAYDYLEGTGVDWANNEGGQGKIIFDLSQVPFKFSANIDVNEVVSTTAFEVEEVA